MYSNERRFGAAPAIPDPSTKKPEDNSRVEKVEQNVAAETQRPVMEENIKTPEVDTNKLVDAGKSTDISQAASAKQASENSKTEEVERPIIDAAKAMEAELKSAGPNIKPVVFKESVSSNKNDAGSGQINVVNANGIVSGAKLVNGMWRTLAVAFLIVAIILAGGLVWLYLQNTSLNEDYKKLSETSSSTTSNLNSLYEKLGATTQEEAAFAASFGDTVDGADILSLRNAMVEKLGDHTIDYSQSDFNSFQRIDGYRIAKLVVNGKKYVAFAKNDNVWTIVEFVESYHDRCDGYSEEARLIVDKLLTCKED